MINILYLAKNVSLVVVFEIAKLFDDVDAFLVVACVIQVREFIHFDVEN